ncbi:MAG: hypothetical protein KDA20_11950 [Phycisphaerales bacterium]|nr:hypothetical protein [Phycisphaerales bacterium]
MGNHEPADQGPMPEPTPAFARDLQALFDDGATHMNAPHVNAAIAQAIRSRGAEVRRAKLLKWSMLSVSSAVAAALVLVALWPGAAPSTPRARAPLASAQPKAEEAELTTASGAEAKPTTQMAMADAAPPAESLSRARSDGSAFSTLMEMDALLQPDPLDVDGNARVDILDAFAIARGVQAGNAPASWDVNGDGAVTQADVDVVAHAAVSLSGKGAAG